MTAETRSLFILSFYPNPHMQHMRHVKLKYVCGGLWQCSLSRWAIDSVITLVDTCEKQYS
jgi:hypothetical protein